MNNPALLSGIVLIVCVVLWVRKPFGLPLSVTALIFLTACVCIGVPVQAAFSGFASGAIWTLIPALFFGFALSSTGLGRRIAYYLLMRVKYPTLPKLLAVFCLVGIILSLLTPSMTVRVVIIAPIAMSCADICGFGRGTKERSVLTITVWLAAVVPGAAWLTGSLNGPLLTGMYEAVGLGEIAFSDWLRASILPVILTVFLTVVFGYLVTGPKGELTADRSVFMAAFSEIGAIKKTEIITAVVLVCCFVMFTIRGLHGLPDAAVCLIGFIVLFIFGIIRTENLGTGISWDLVIFLGAVLGFGAVFEHTGLSTLLIGVITPAVAPVASSSPGLFLLLAVIVMFVWRFVDIATFVPTFAIITAMIPVFFREFGINPLVWLPILTLAQSTFLMSYTNFFALVAERSMGEDGWETKTFFKYSLVYCVAVLAAVAVSLPYWTAQGFFA